MKKVKMSRLVTSLLISAALLGLTACGNNQAQPNNNQGQTNQNQGQAMTQGQGQSNQAQVRNAQVKNAPINRNNQSTGTKSVDHPYVHNYDGSYDGTRPNTYTERDVRSAELLSRRVTNIAKTVPGVNRAQAVAQGIDVVIGIETSGNNLSIERQVQQKVKSAEPGYNIYVTSNPDLQNRIRTLFTAKTNVRHGQITHGISGIIYEMGRLSAQQAGNTTGGNNMNTNTGTNNNTTR